MNCNRCGIEISESAVERRKARGTFDGRCHDCRGHTAHEVKYNGEPCRPWRGEVDEDFNPIDKNLKLYLPGVRTCGHKDCVNKQHIISPFNILELERNDISYRTGEPSTAEHFLREIA
jgi:hypothetical protein